MLADCSSVLMAEAAAIALAIDVAQCMNLTNISFLSDCQQLVHFLNAADHSNPPDWRIKHFTQLFSNHSRSREFKIFKINRHLNTMADALARQALSHLVSQGNHFESSYSYEHQDHQCSLLQALENVSLTNVMLLSARCC
jgi:ribonuclease HI